MLKLCKYWKKNLLLNYMLMFIFFECMVFSFFYLLWICVVDVGNDVVIWFVYFGIFESF